MIPNQRIAAVREIREYGEGMPVELWMNTNGRLEIRAFNEDGHNYTATDLCDILKWLKEANTRELLHAAGVASLLDTE